MVKIRLTRTGRKNHAAFRVVAIDSRSARDSRAIEELGHYLPHTKEFKVNQERVEYWLSVGAQPSETVARQLVKAEILPKDYLESKKFNHTPGQKSQDRAAAKAEKIDAAKQAAAKPKQEEAQEEVVEQESESESTESSSTEE